MELNFMLNFNVFVGIFSVLDRRTVFVEGGTVLHQSFADDGSPVEAEF
jgi:hypothetical protein